MPFDPQQTFVHLASDGTATELPGGASFWSLPPPELERYGQSWVVLEFACAADWPSWEMHPNGDEFVYLLAGSIELLLDYPDGIRTMPIRGSGAVLVPRGIWHTAKVHEPSRMLHVTLGGGTQTRAA